MRSFVEASLLFATLFPTTMLMFWVLQKPTLIQLSFITKYNTGSAWMTGLIKIIWNHLFEAWELRNKDRHGAEVDIQLQIRMGRVRRQIRVLYHLRPLCNLITHHEGFYESADQHFSREPRLSQLEAWIVTYEPMIRTRARIQQQLNQQGLQAIDMALEQSHTQDS